MGYYQMCNILLDSGCQNTLISEKCAQRLNLIWIPSKIFVSGLGNIKTGVTRGKIEIEVRSIHSDDKFYMQAYIFNNLTSKLSCTKLSINCCDEIKNIPLADNKFNIPKEIYIIIGFDYFFPLMRKGSIWQNGKLLAQNTAFGWGILINHCGYFGKLKILNL